MNSDKPEKMPPSCLDGFLCVALPSDADTGACFELACRQCNGSSFRIEAYSKIAPDPSPYFAIDPGRVIHRPPHRLHCTTCRISVPLFDARTQGYDGILNGGCSYESGEGESSLVTGEFQFVVSLGYSIELSELEELAVEAKVRTSDLFDSIWIVGTPVREGEKFEVAYECA